MTRKIFWARTAEAPILPPPPQSTGFGGWLKENLFAPMTNFSSVGSTIVSLLMAVLTLGAFWYGIKIIWAVIDFAFISAVWNDPEGIKRLSCATTLQKGKLPEDWKGACWPFVKAKWKLWMYGTYNVEQLWRVNLAYIIGAIGLVWLLIEKLPYRRIAAVLMLLVYPVITLVLLTGGDLHQSMGNLILWGLIAVALIAVGWMASKGSLGEGFLALSGTLLAVGLIIGGIMLVRWFFSLDFGLETVPSSKWGGLLVTLVVAITGIVASLPLGILLALGRRSTLPAVRWVSIAFIEFWRGVPLITVLFMSSVMLPLFLPEGTEFNKLLRALIGVALFASAYMAEVIRGGMQAIPKGQYEGAQALGLSYWKMMRLIILPQALTLVIPGIVNTFIGLFKDTTLVLIIGLFDLLGQIQNTFTDPSWSTPVTTYTGYLVCGFIFWVFCFGMSRYSMYMEQKLYKGHKR